MKFIYRLSDCFHPWQLLVLVAGLMMLAPSALATDQLYQNYAVLNYTIPGNPPPNLDVLAFDNENEFDVGFFQNSPGIAFYQPKDTLFYTNNGTMTANASIVTTLNGLFFLSGNTYGAGYKFDHLTTNVIPHSMADTFYNPGTIRCDSAIDGNNFFIFGSSTFFFEASIGQCIVSATNIISPGVIDVGVNGLMQFGGQNVDLSRSTLILENLQSLFLGNSVGLFATAAGFGIDTNRDWDPSVDLKATTAVSSLPFIINLTNSTAYFDIEGNVSNIIYRAVFVQNTSPNVPYNVYIDPLNVTALFNAGAAHVEWIGTYVDPTTGTIITNYLYLTDDYLQGASTNLFFLNGIPDNFQFLTSTTPLLPGSTPTPPGFLPVFSSGVVTNPYSYFNAQLISTTAPTNVTPSNPQGALTNLPSRIQITASKELNLNLALISGQNYLSLLATNQFDGSDGAQIAAPYSDINLGVTNGLMTVSNLLQSALPNWNGTIQAWSTRWLTTFTNTLDGTNFFTSTNDFRVLIVGSDRLKPVSAPQVQNLKLHTTNLVISDVLNVFGTLYIDAQNLTLTTNAFGNGASSAEGELNLESSAILWQTCLPNVRNLTNNGAITTHNQVVFGGAAPANYFSFVNHGLISDLGATVYADYFEDSNIFTNGAAGSFLLQSRNTILTNGILSAGGDISITTTNLVISSLVLQAGRSLTLAATNQLTDISVTNGSVWTVGGGTGNNFLSLPVKPPTGDLLGTTITLIAPTNKNDLNIWAATNRGVDTSGFTNNVAIGHLILDSFGAYGPPSHIGSFTFKGTGVSNALYVDFLELRDAATNRDINGNFSAITNLGNMVIYFARADMNGVSVADKMNGKNNNSLRWVTNYAGFFSSTNFVFPAGVTNGPFNLALAQSLSIDSDGDGVANGNDSLPFFTGNMINQSVVRSNNVSPTYITWNTVPNATNAVLYFDTNFVWSILTNGAIFSSPLGATVHNPNSTNFVLTFPAAHATPISVTVTDPSSSLTRSYKIRVDTQH